MDYVASLLWIKLGLGFFPGPVVGVFAAGVMSLLVSLPAWRLKGGYFVMISIAVQTLIYVTLYNWTELTNGLFGISGIACLVIASYSFVTTGFITVLYGVLALRLATNPCSCSAWSSSAEPAVCVSWHTTCLLS